MRESQARSVSKVRISGASGGDALALSEIGAISERRIATLVDPADAEFMNRQVSAEVLTRTDGVMLVLFSTRWRLEGFQRDNPDVKLGSLVAAEG